MTREQVAVVGIGAIGGTFAAALAELDRVDLTLCARTPFDELIVEHPGGVVRARPKVVTDRNATSHADWVLLATKAYESEATRPWLDALCTAQTSVVVLQNGVDQVTRIAPLVPEGTAVLPSVVRVSSERIAPGHIRQAKQGQLLVPDTPQGRALAQLFEGARVEVTPVADFLTQAWWKLMFNAALGGVCTLALRPNSVVADAEVRSLVLALMQEIVAVGQAEGAALTVDSPAECLDLILGSAPQHWTSIASDRRAGRPTEWQARNQIVCTLGRRHRIPTPLNDVIATLLRVADSPSLDRPR